MKRWIYRITAGLALAAAILGAQIVLLPADNRPDGEAGADPQTLSDRHADTNGSAVIDNATVTDAVANDTDSAVPAAWASMATGELVIESGSTDTLTVRIADETAERAQGMQHLPGRVVRDNPIWFVFPEPRRTGWHMRNVRIPLDIVYVDETGQVIAIERMAPGQTGYGIDQPIAAALEVAAGEAKRLGIEPGVRLALAR